MKLEVGMYVRTLKGIVKIDEIKDGVMKDTKGYLHYGDFIKASHNIIDLIEVGDYVNDFRVVWKNINKKEVFINAYYEDERLIKNSKQVKSIVTKEQFEQMQYKVGE